MSVATPTHHTRPLCNVLSIHSLPFFNPYSSPPPPPPPPPSIRQGLVHWVIIEHSHTHIHTHTYTLTHNTHKTHATHADTHTQVHPALDDVVVSHCQLTNPFKPHLHPTPLSLDPHSGSLEGGGGGGGTTYSSSALTHPQAPTVNRGRWRPSRSPLLTTRAAVAMT